MKYHSLLVAVSVPTAEMIVSSNNDNHKEMMNDDFNDEDFDFDDYDWSLLMPAAEAEPNYDFDYDDFDWSSSMPAVEAEAKEISPPSTSTTPRQTPDDVQVVSALFAKQNIHDTPPELVKSLSPAERIKSYEDVHGVSEPIQETPELLATSLEKLVLALKTVLDNNYDPLHRGYTLASLQAPDYVEQQLPKFLRAEGFDIPQAKVRALKFFDAKLRLFGPSAMGRELGLNDLKDIDLQVLREGGVQLLTEPDQRGRPIMGQFSKVCIHYPPEIVAKLMLWAAMIVSRDENNQRRGMIIIHYGVDVPGAYSADSAERGVVIVSIIPCMPIRTMAFHVCINEPSALTRISLVTQVLGGPYACRIQSHFGTHLECRYNLMTFGIPLSVMSVVRNDGSMDLSKHLAWFARMEQEETTALGDTDETTTAAATVAVESTKNGVAPPGEMDVIMGKGLRGRSSRGNQLLKRLVEERQQEYNSGVRIKKAIIAGEIYTYMRRKGCRFLAPSKTEKNAAPSITTAPTASSGNSEILVWEEVLEAEAVNRICHTFRNLRQMLAKRSTEGTNKALL